MINLTDYKNIKKIKIVKKDLDEVHKRLTSCIETLKDYKKYIQVMESISVLHSSRTLIEIHIHKFNILLKEEK